MLASNHAMLPKLAIVMGVSGCGKSTLAERLATHFCAEYLDADDFHSDEAKSLMNLGIPLTDEMRVPWVDRIRAHLNGRFAEGKNCVLAFSGLRRAHRALIRQTHYDPLFIFLDAKPNSIASRVEQRQNHFMNPALVDSQFDALERPEGEHDIIRVDADHSSEQVFQQAVAALAPYFSHEVDRASASNQ